MKIKVSKKEVQKQVEEFFNEVKKKTPKEIKKIKRLAMGKNIALKDKKKLFCKKCLSPYLGKEKIRIKKGMKIVECKNCGSLARWNLNTIK